MFSDRHVAIIANAQRHVPISPDAIQRFTALGVRPADVYGVIQYMATIIGCDPDVIRDRLARPEERELVLQSLLLRLRTNAPLIVNELRRNPDLLGPLPSRKRENP